MDLGIRHRDDFARSQQDPRAVRATPEDPRFVLIGVEVHAAVFLEVNKPKPVILYELAKGWLTGAAAEMGETHRVGPHSRPS
jgi:hypothetical protein